MCKHFRKFNLFEIKGIHSTLTTDAYYKITGYAGIFIQETGHANEYTRHNLTLNFVSRHFPRNLIRHLTKDCNKVVEKTAPGIYYIREEMYSTQFLVTGELEANEYLYLKCLTNDLTDRDLINRLVRDYKRHPDNTGYLNYMNQLTHANIRKGGNTPMVCEGILELCGTSSAEIEKKARKQADDYYQPLLNEQINLVNEKDRIISQLLEEIETLRKNQS